MGSILTGIIQQLILTKSLKYITGITLLFRDYGKLIKQIIIKQDLTIYKDRIKWHFKILLIFMLQLLLRPKEGAT